MDNENLAQEVRELKRILGYFLLGLGAMQAIRQPIDLRTPEGQEAGRAALNGFAALVKLAMEESGEQPSEAASWLKWMN